MKSIINGVFGVVGLMLTMSAIPLSVSAADVTSLRQYYRYYQIPSAAPSQDFVVTGFPPEVRVTGGGTDPSPVVNEFGTFRPVDRLFRVAPFFEGASEVRFPSGFSLAFGEAVSGSCEDKYVKLPWSFAVGFQFDVLRAYYVRVTPADVLLGRDPPCGDHENGIGPAWQVTDRITLRAPIRRKAIDGSEYEASPMMIEREGVPWMTYYAGYRLGFVAGESNWDNNNLSKTPALATWPTLPNPCENFELVRLPRPFVEGEVVEYVNEIDFPNAPGGQYFYATSQADQAALDAVPNWWRTGHSFKSGGYVPVCRLYGSVVPGPNTHFYSADESECTSLRANSALHYEGQPFRASKLIPSTGGCPTMTIPLYRWFNNPSGKGYDPNHRYATNRDLLLKLIPRGWVYEGAVM